MRFSFVAIVGTLLSACTVLAQAPLPQAYPTLPVATTIWRAGATVQVRWKLQDPNSVAGLKVELLSGNNPQTQKIVAVLGIGAPKATSLSAPLAADLASDWYSVRIGGDSYSHYFRIQGVGPLPSGPAPTAPGPLVPTAALNTTVAVPTVVPTTTTSSTVQTPLGPPPGSAANGRAMGAPLAIAAAAVLAAALAL